MRSGSEIRIPTMTTNKPEVVAWRWRKPVVNDHGETVGFTAWELSDTPGFLPWWTNDPLIRLSDYEALQAECEKPAPDVVGLMEALVEAASVALDAIGDVLDDAYHNAEQVCCGRAGSECCGATEPVLSESDQAIMDKFAPIYQALENALAAYRNGCEV